jgi:hypothetical protein
MRRHVLLRAAFNLHLWTSARLLPLRLSRKSMTAVRNYAARTSSTPYAGLPAAYVVHRAWCTARRPLFMRDRRCLREGLLGYRFLCLAGYHPELRFGIDPESLETPVLKAHCWVCLDGRPVLSESHPGMIEIMRIPDQGQRALAAA